MSRVMKNSGVPWLTDIPKTWNVERGKAILTLQKRPVREEDEVITCFRDGEVVLRSERRTEGFTMSDKEIGYQGINKGDIVIHGMDGFAGAMGVSKSTGKGSPVLVVCTPKYDAVPQYIIYYLRALAMTNVFVALATGVRERSCDLRWNKIAELDFIIPPAAEQQSIADFLDKKCGEIDEMISLQEKIVEELKAYKQSVITEVVCKGLNPDVPMKDSGIEWIGNIPEHWKVSFITKNLQSIVDYRGKTPEKVVDGVFLITARNIKDGKIDYEISKEYVKAENYEEIMHRGKPEIGDVLFTTEAPLGAVANIDKCNVALAQRVIKFRPKEKVLNPFFLKYWIMSMGFQQFLHTLSTGSTAAGIKASKLFLLRVLLPTIEEQRAIAEYLDTKCTEIDTLISLKQSKIEALKDYKKAIIYEYITGKEEING